MAKTRSQTRKEECSLQTTGLQAKLSQRLKKQPKKSGNIRVLQMKDCVSRLNRLKADEISALIATKKADPNTSNCRVLRQRENVSISKEKTPRSVNQLVALSQTALFTSRALRVWDVIKKKNTRAKLDIDDVVLARMSGHRPWPGKITKFGKNGTFVYFFGTQETGVVKRAEIVQLHLCKDVIEEYLKVPLSHISSKTIAYHMQFVKACKEVSCLNVMR